MALASLALDRAGRPHIAYWDNSANALRYARRTGPGSTWITQTVEAGMAWIAGSGRVSLALDRGDHPYISYSDETNRSLKVAGRGVQPLRAHHFLPLVPR